MEARKSRGAEIAQDPRIKLISGATWFVPSTTKASGGHVVDLLASSCTCEDFELRRLKCKHLWAVELRQARAANDVAIDATSAIAGAIVSNIEAPPSPPESQPKAKRKTYKQDWPRYNAAQCAEKATFQQILRSLCDHVQTPPHLSAGPKPIARADVIYAMVLKVYTTVSGRRATTDIRACADAGRLERAPHYNSVFRGFENVAFTPILESLVERSATPLAEIETTFATDSTGIGTVNYRRWYDTKYGCEKTEQGWIKLHATCGTITNVITAVKVTPSNTNDSPELPGLLVTTARSFRVVEMSADKAYLSHDNLRVIEAVGATPYVPFKTNSQGNGSPAWRRMWAMFVLEREKFLARYHQRSNVESAFSALKRLFGGAVRSKNPVAQTNEVLCKVICHNLAVLVHAMFELDVVPTFVPQQAKP